MTKYDWSNVPLEIIAMTTSKNGVVRGYSKPILIGNQWCVSYVIDNMQPFDGDWQDSLEERPTEKDLPETVVKSLGEVA
ncbi:hypothetical protein [Acinetobacter sp.]|uniref:hypothetical protein n=1 Tax=Acinetobacter sp. TaxID=472 RepID=UPI002489AFE0|nr:hypothetical protein [Acinetobacter sp.]MDI1222942.1 hypothetical protein [Acinetobacter sp.]